MECFDGAEVCDLVGVYILHLLRTVMRKENDGLGILRNSSGPEIERKRKQVIQIFKYWGLNITVKKISAEIITKKQHGRRRIKKQEWVADEELTVMKNKKHTMRQDLIIAQRDGFFHTVTKASDNHTSESLLTEVYMTIYTCYNLNQLEEQLSFNKITRCRLQQNLSTLSKIHSGNFDKFFRPAFS